MRQVAMHSWMHIRIKTSAWSRGAEHIIRGDEASLPRKLRIHQVRRQSLHASPGKGFAHVPYLDSNRVLFPLAHATSTACMHPEPLHPGAEDDALTSPLIRVALLLHASSPKSTRIGRRHSAGAEVFLRRLQGAAVRHAADRICQVYIGLRISLWIVGDERWGWKAFAAVLPGPHRCCRCFDCCSTRHAHG
jgi:hypothetical protein